ncbi:ECF RNA polymerase sigma-E factor [Anatilimnocola aggregata]|uniref:ECF RNA polymerase sigma-E factor n=1 Tax=Anatilimnocola aggregata TaxID=2528021 RepID=A0A517YP24_9BACT|nr:RNA polymerase sigma factor [Anatilimnocola aggregata]QDU31970.1 ECF RNA polymerase sigma-E factor [Anatilimnocola aggregata]
MTEPAPIADGPLIAAALAGDDSAFAQIAQRYQGPLLHAAQSRLSDRQLAEDAVQEALLCAYRWLHTYDSQYSFRTWLWTILLNQCSRIAQRRSKQPAASMPGERTTEQAQTLCLHSHEPRTEASPFEQLLARESAERLHQLLARLPEPQADALRLRFFGGLKFEEIAQAMECSVSGAKNRVRLGLTQLATWLKRTNLQHPTNQATAPQSASHAGDSR